MNKTDKKRDKQIVKALTIVCETAKIEISDFRWLTHHIDYKNYPASLKIICTFDTSSAIEQATKNNQGHMLYQLIQRELEKINIKLNDISRHVSFKTE